MDRLCGCNCGQPLPDSMRPQARYLPNHRQRAYRIRRLGVDSIERAATRFWSGYERHRRRRPAIRSHDASVVPQP